MIAGIPGAGIGGLYYILLAFLMPLHEACLVCRRKSSVKRWLSVGMQVVNGGGIVLAVWLTGWLIGRGMHAMTNTSHGVSGTVAAKLPAVMSRMGAIYALGTLGAVVTLSSLAHFLIPRRKDRA
jgi:hypothetical protein